MSPTLPRCFWLWLPVTVMLSVFCSRPAKSLDWGPPLGGTKPDVLDPFTVASWIEPQQESSDDASRNDGNGENTNGKSKRNGEAKPPEHIRDNSFLVEEAYNQEPGVVQHIMTWDTRWTHHL